MPKRSTATVIAVLLLVIVGIQAVPYGRNHTNPPVRLEPPWDGERTRELAVRACFDCHSNETVWPWYTNVAPVSWWISGGVEEGREALNFSEWDRVQEEAHEAAEVVLEGEMPPNSYVLLHPEAALDPAELLDLAEGLRAAVGVGGRGESRDADD